MRNKIVKIQKRDGTIVDFDQTKITEAIFKALTATGQGDGVKSKRLSNKVVQILNRRFKKPTVRTQDEIPSVEQVQDIVEEVLILEGFVETAKAYILYREQRRRIREATRVVDESSEKIDSYLQEVDWQINENANMTFSLQGLNQYVGSYISKKYWLNKIYPPEIREAASNEDFHIHNLEILATYCAGWDLYDFLRRGFGGVSGKLECRPPKHFRTALGQLVNILFTLQGETAGANAISNFDTLLAPFVRYDGLSYPQVKQAIQEFLYNCMVPTRVGFQSLCWDELVIVKKKGKIKFVEIGKLVDAVFNKSSHRIIEKNPSSYAIENYDDYCTLSFDDKGKAVWSKIKAFVRHRVPQNSEFVKIKTGRGEARVSKAHSLFSFSEFNGKFNPEPKSAEDINLAKNYQELNSKNHFIALKSFENQSKKTELDLVEVLDEIPQLHKNVFVKINPVHTLEKIRQNIILEKQSFVPFYKEFGLKDRGIWKDWLEKKSIRYEIWRKYGDLTKMFDFKLKNSDAFYPRILKGELLENFIKLCAWYITEGHTAISTPLYISQSPSKYSEEIIEILQSLNALGQIAKNKSYSQKRKINGEVLKITGKGLLSEIISRNCGYLSFNKVIPSFIFELSSKYQKIFFETLLKGDASEYKTHWDFDTTSKKLSLSLSLLLAQNNYRFNVYGEDTSKINKKWHDKWKIRIYKDNSISRKSYFVNDFEAKSCLKIDKFKYEKEYEYDISVDLPQENFIGGSGLLIFHNTPFLNVSLDIKPPSFLAKQPVIIGGQPQKETYEEFQPEMDMFIRAFYEGLMEGDAKGRPFTFPIPTVSITKDFDWDNENLVPLWEATAKYGVNYFSNFIQSDMKPEDFRSMCCRLRLSNKELYMRGGGLFGSQPLTGCYDEKTEILTENGWKLFKDLTRDENVFTLTKNNEIELHKPKKLFEYDFDGKMYHFKTKSLDLLVTPNHRMVVDNAYKKYKREFVSAENFNPNSHWIPKRSVWKGEEKEYFILPSVEIFKGNGPASSFSEEEVISIQNMRKDGLQYYKIAESFDCSLVTVLNICANPRYGKSHISSYYSEPIKIKMDNWLKFFGFWIAEGCTDNENIALRHGYRTIITQVNKEKKKEIKNVLDALPFNYYIERDINFVICSKQLWSYLRQFGNKYQKFIPQEIKNLSKKQLGILFDWMVKGDGHIRKTTGQINYWTASKKLADDLQEVILKLGWLGTVVSQKKNVSFIKGRPIRPGIVYIIGVQKAKHYRLRENNPQKVYYKGKVYCCEVENHTVFVRRNGRVSWCGNSIGVVTVNMPRIGYLSKTKKDFFGRLGHLMDLAKESLEIKRKALENFIEKGLYPYSRYYLASVKKMRSSYFGNHFSTIGLMGLNESLLNFLGENIGSVRGRKFAVEVLDFMRDRLIKYQQETGNMYNLEATPGEGTSYRQAKSDREKYPDIITAGTKEVPYYTNSSQLPVGYTDDIFEALKLQNDLQCKYNGGTVLHIFLGEKINDPEMAKILVKKIFGKFHLPYITLTPTFSICPSHGYLEGEHFECPKCLVKQPCEVYSRVVGYLRPVQQWHKGKKQEFKERKEFKIPVGL